MSIDDAPLVQHWYDSWMKLYMQNVYEDAKEFNECFSLFCIHIHRDNFIQTCRKRFKCILQTILYKCLVTTTRRFPFRNCFRMGFTNSLHFCKQQLTKRDVLNDDHFWRTACGLFGSISRIYCSQIGNTLTRVAYTSTTGRSCSISAWTNIYWATCRSRWGFCLVQCATASKDYASNSSSRTIARSANYATYLPNCDDLCASSVFRTNCASLCAAFSGDSSRYLPVRNYLAQHRVMTLRHPSAKMSADKFAKARQQSVRQLTIDKIYHSGQSNSFQMQDLPDSHKHYTFPGQWKLSK
jgi:hypothetical protein